MKDKEVEAAIQEAEIEIEAHRLGVFIRNSENKEALDKKCLELQNMGAEWTWHNKLDLLTQGALARVLFGIVKHPEDNPLNNLKRAFAIGYQLGKQEAKCRQHRK